MKPGIWTIEETLRFPLLYRRWLYKQRTGTHFDGDIRNLK